MCLGAFLSVFYILWCNEGAHLTMEDTPMLEIKKGIVPDFVGILGSLLLWESWCGRVRCVYNWDSQSSNTTLTSTAELLRLVSFLLYLEACRVLLDLTSFGWPTFSSAKSSQCDIVWCALVACSTYHAFLRRSHFFQKCQSSGISTRRKLSQFWRALWGITTVLYVEVTICITGKILL